MRLLGCAFQNERVTVAYQISNCQAIDLQEGQEKQFASWNALLVAQMLDLD